MVVSVDNCLPFFLLQQSLSLSDIRAGSIVVTVATFTIASNASDTVCVSGVSYYCNKLCSSKQAPVYVTKVQSTVKSSYANFLSVSPRDTLTAAISKS